MCKKSLIISLLFGYAAIAPAQAAAPQNGGKVPLSGKQPIEISSDKLDVYQNDHKAIFTGNVIATQGTTNMRAAQMIVYYADNGGAKAGSTQPKPAKPTQSAGAPQGITRIESSGNVVFTTPTQTAQGDLAIYTAATNTIDLTGKTVTLTQDKNVLKGTKLNYNMDTGRSVLTGGGAGPNQPARVHGLFVPKSDDNAKAGNAKK